MSTNRRYPIRLPEFEEHRSFGGRLVERAVTITLLSLVLLAVATLFVLMNFPVESAVEASGVLESSKVAEGKVLQWKVVLKVPELEINRIQLGAPVKVLIPAALEEGPWNGEALPARVASIGSELAAGSAPSRGLYRVEATLEMHSISSEQLKLFRNGMTTEAHVITRSGLASDLILLHFRREFDLDGNP